MSDNKQKNEMVDDVLTEMLERADAMQNHGTTHGVRLAIREFASRIKSAWKRQEQCYLDQIRDAVNMIGHERFVKEHPPSGNASAMREAILNIQEYADAMDVDDGNVLAILDSCRDALSAPARNCDRFRTKYDARAYFDNIVCQRSNGSGSIECKGCPLDRIDNPHRADCREEWLFATA